jgi:N-acetyl-anhydromuramoyl-L-alanine amidase
LSAHFVIHRDSVLGQFVSCDQGASTFFSRERCNDLSIAIELKGGDTTTIESTQCETLEYSNIAPGRKTDPGSHFERARLKRDTALADQYFSYPKFSKTL